MDRILAKQFVMTDSGTICKIGDLYTTFNPDVDLAALREGYIEVVDRMMEPVTLRLDDRSPEVIAYWAKQGMVKEFHGDTDVFSWTEYEAKTGYKWSYGTNEGTQNYFRRWNSFVPVSAFSPEGKGRRYPVVIVLHGGFNPISIIDGWGWVQEAARREWIVIAPSIELDDVLDEILAEAKELYPIDESRIYLTGFSYGGYMTSQIGNKRPDVYAAVAPCGAPLTDGNHHRLFGSRGSGPEPMLPFDGTPRALALGTCMPVMNVYGQLDGNRFPFYDYRNPETGESGAKALVDGLNNWARANRAPEVSLDAVMALKGRPDITECERRIGVPFEEGCTETVTRDGITSHIGSLKSEDGIARVRIMCTMNMPHWPTPEMSRQVFSFFSHFSRDPRTKASLYRESDPSSNGNCGK